MTPARVTWAASATPASACRSAPTSAPWGGRAAPRGEGVMGMPMGYPSMTDEELGILRAWIEQGCPGPTAVTGKPGFTDGFLVPDGPIRGNPGCQLRRPAR